MNKALIRGAVGAATATALAISAIAPATAAPVLSNTAAVKSAADTSCCLAPPIVGHYQNCSLQGW